MNKKEETHQPDQNDRNDAHLSKKMRRDSLVTSYQEILDRENALKRDAERIMKDIEKEESEFYQKKSELKFALTTVHEKIERFSEETQNKRDLLLTAINGELWRDMIIEPTLRKKRDGYNSETVMNTRIYFDQPAVCVASFSSGKTSEKDIKLGHIWFCPEGKYECPDLKKQSERSSVMVLYGRWTNKEDETSSFEVYSVSEVKLNPWLPQASYKVASIADTTCNLENKIMVRTALSDTVIDCLVACLQTKLDHESTQSDDNICSEEVVVMQKIIEHLLFLQAPVSIALDK